MVNINLLFLGPVIVQTLNFPEKSFLYHFIPSMNRKKCSKFSPYASEIKVIL